MLGRWMDENRVATGFIAGAFYVLVITVFTAMTNREDEDRAELEQRREDEAIALARKAFAGTATGTAGE